MPLATPEISVRTAYVSHVPTPARSQPSSTPKTPTSEEDTHTTYTSFQADDSAVALQNGGNVSRTARQFHID